MRAFALTLALAVCAPACALLRAPFLWAQTLAEPQLTARVDRYEKPVPSRVASFEHFLFYSSHGVKIYVTVGIAGTVGAIRTACIDATTLTEPAMAI